MGRNRAKTILILASVLLVVTLLCAATQGTTEVVYKTVMECPLYREADFASETVIAIPQNAVVEPIGDPFDQDGFSWRKIRYSGAEGYVLATDIFVSSKNDNYTFIVGKGKSRTMGEPIGLYSIHTENAEPVRYMYDGESVRIVDDGISYGKYLRVEYDGTYYYALADQVTTGLSYNQTLAIIIIGSVAGAVGIGLIVFFLIRRRKKKID